jgi:hypothetical protein
LWNNKPFGECVEGLSHCEVEVYVINGAVHSGDFEDSPLRVAIIIRWLARKESSQRLAESILRYANHDVARVWLYFWCTVLLMAFSPIFFVWADSNERLTMLKRNSERAMTNKSLLQQKIRESVMQGSSVVRTQAELVDVLKRDGIAVLRTSNGRNLSLLGYTNPLVCSQQMSTCSSRARL